MQRVFGRWPTDVESWLGSPSGTIYANSFAIGCAILKLKRKLRKRPGIDGVGTEAAPNAIGTNLPLAAQSENAEFTQ